MFERATKQKTKLRLAVFGPSGAGKSYTSLRIAVGLAAATTGGARIAVICTERGRARKYSDRFTFDVLDLTDYTIDGYKKAIREAELAGYDVLIIDSISHEWQQLCIENDKLAERKFRGNTWAAWSESTPRHQDFIAAIMAYPGHVICTMRSTTEWVKGADGSSKPKKIGLKPEQGKNIEYEFDMLMELSIDHVGTVTKDITGIYQDQDIAKPSEEVGQKLAAWLGDGATAPNKAIFGLPHEAHERSKHSELMKLVEQHDINDQTIMGWCEHFSVSKTTEFSDEQLSKLIDAIHKKYKEEPLLVA